MTTDNQRNQWRVRVLNGPLRDAAIPIDNRLTIGRATSSDVQIVHDGISRQHANIITDDRGRHILVDLDSSNGTFVDGQRVRRHLLEPGVIFKIICVSLVYEPNIDTPVGPEDSGVFALQREDGRTLRGTVEYDGRDPQRIGQYLDPESDTPVQSVTERPTSMPMAQARGDERHRIVATRDDGTEYDGSLLDDIVEFRALRNRATRGERLSRQQLDELIELEPPLRSIQDGDVPSRRRFERFASRFPARLRFADGTELPVRVSNIGVDGACVDATDHRIDERARVWLAIDLVSRGRAHTVVFTSTVIWTNDNRLGLAFPSCGELGDSRDTARTRIGLGHSSVGGNADTVDAPIPV
ncbi:MAG: FHA domain-containing protein [Deltaproteobacteria bacterium]|nr:FHA domain-containing protein [Deltaproteobacteria bacterium]